MPPFLSPQSRRGDDCAKFLIESNRRGSSATTPGTLSTWWQSRRGSYQYLISRSRKSHESFHINDRWSERLLWNLGSNNPFDLVSLFFCEGKLKATKQKNEFVGVHHVISLKICTRAHAHEVRWVGCGKWRGDYGLNSSPSSPSFTPKARPFQLAHKKVSLCTARIDANFPSSATPGHNKHHAVWFE